MPETVYLVGDVNVQLDEIDPVDVSVEPDIESVDSDIDGITVDYGNLPRGGHADDLLIKQSDRNYDALWVSQHEAGFRHIYYDTTENWSAKTTLISEEGALYIYKDYSEESGETLPGIKIGDGTSYVVDLPFLAEDVANVLADSVRTIDEIERNFTTTVTDSFVAPKNLYTGNLIVIQGALYQVAAYVARGEELAVGLNIVRRDIENYVGRLTREPYPYSPADLGTPYAGSSDRYSRGDHVHRKPTPAEIGAYAKPAGGIPASDIADGVIPPIFVAEYGVSTFDEVYRALSQGYFVIAYTPDEPGWYARPLVAWPDLDHGYIYFSTPIYYIPNYSDPYFDHASVTIYSLEYGTNFWDNYLGIQIPWLDDIPMASDSTPSSLGTPASGSSDSFSRADHVHPMPTAADVGAVALADASHIYYDTTANWNSRSTLVAEAGALYVYSDHSVVNGENVPGVKIGDGLAYLIDMPFVADDIANSITTHINNSAIHVSSNDRRYWNNKVTAIIDLLDSEHLILTTEDV